MDALSSLAIAGDQEAVCYLCLDVGSEEPGQPLRRDCACRGSDAGFVHLSCLVKYAETKSKQAREMNEFRDPWHTCPNCNQYYQNEFAVDIAAKFVSFVRGKYLHDTKRQVEALHVKLRALNAMFERLQPVQKTEAGVTAHVLLSMIDRFKAEVSSLSIRYSQMKSEAYNVHGRIALHEGSEESARRAVTHLEKCLEVSEVIGDAEGVATAKNNVAYAKSKYEGTGNNEDFLKSSQEIYELRVAEFGEEHESTISSGRIYAINLRIANRGDEARELLTELLATSKQVLGPHHNTTKKVESELE